MENKDSTYYVMKTDPFIHGGTKYFVVRDDSVISGSAVTKVSKEFDTEYQAEVRRRHKELMHEVKYGT